GDRRMDKHHIRLRKITLLMPSQHKMDGKATQGIQRSGERLGPLQVSDRHVCPLARQIARQTNTTAKGAEPHDRHPPMLPGGWERRHIISVPCSMHKYLYKSILVSRPGSSPHSYWTFL